MPAVHASTTCQLRRRRRTKANKDAITCILATVGLSGHQFEELERSANESRHCGIGSRHSSSLEDVVMSNVATNVERRKGSCGAFVCERQDGRLCSVSGRTRDKRRSGAGNHHSQKPAELCFQQPLTAPVRDHNRTQGTTTRILLPDRLLIVQMGSEASLLTASSVLRPASDT